MLLGVQEKAAGPGLMELATQVVRKATSSMKKSKKIIADNV